MKTEMTHEELMAKFEEFWAELDPLFEKAEARAREEGFSDSAYIGRHPEVIDRSGDPTEEAARNRN